MQALLGVGGFILFMGCGILQIVAGYVGIDFHFYFLTPSIIERITPVLRMLNLEQQIMQQNPSANPKHPLHQKILLKIIIVQCLKTPNKNMHSDKIKLRSFLTTLYFAGDVKRYVQ
jgi:hypothetical protein